MLADIFAESLADAANGALSGAPGQAPVPSPQSGAGAAQAVLASATRTEATPSAPNPGSLPHDAQGGSATQTTVTVHDGGGPSRAQTMIIPCWMTWLIFSSCICCLA